MCQKITCWRFFLSTVFSQKSDDLNRSSWNSLSKKVHFCILYSIICQVMVKTKLTKSYQIKHSTHRAGYIFQSHLKKFAQIENIFAQVRDRSLFLWGGAVATNKTPHKNLWPPLLIPKKWWPPFGIYKKVMTPLPHMTLSWSYLHVTTILSNSIIEIWLNREGFNFKLAMVKTCSNWPLLNEYALWNILKCVFRRHRQLRPPI